MNWKTGTFGYLAEKTCRKVTFANFWKMLSLSGRD